jgi:hypothetical protein
MARQRDYDEEDDRDYREERRPRRRRDQDEEPAPSGGGGSTAVKIIAIIGGVFLLIALICGGAVYYVVSSAKKGLTNLQEKLSEEIEKEKKRQENSDKTKSKKFADSFLQELKANRSDAAYQMTSAGYRQRVPQDQFAELLKQHSATIGAAMPFRINPFDPDMGTTYRYTASSFAQGKRWEIAVTVVKEGQNWKVDQLSVDEKQGP